MAVLGLSSCARAFSSCGKWGLLFIAVRGPLTIAASLVVEHRLQTRRLSNCGSQAQLLRGMWDLLGPGLEPLSPALAGGFLTTAPPGKPQRTSYVVLYRCKGLQYFTAILDIFHLLSTCPIWFWVEFKGGRKGDQIPQMVAITLMWLKAEWQGTITNAINGGLSRRQVDPSVNWIFYLLDHFLCALHFTIHESF